MRARAAETSFKLETRWAIIAGLLLIVPTSSAARDTDLDVLQRVAAGESATRFIHRPQFHGAIRTGDTRRPYRFRRARPPFGHSHRGFAPYPAENLRERMLRADSTPAPGETAIATPTLTAPPTTTAAEPGTTVSPSTPTPEPCGNEIRLVQDLGAFGPPNFTLVTAIRSHHVVIMVPEPEDPEAMTLREGFVDVRGNFYHCPDGICVGVVITELEAGDTIPYPYTNSTTMVHLYDFFGIAARAIRGKCFTVEEDSWSCGGLAGICPSQGQIISEECGSPESGGPLIVTSSPALAVSAANACATVEHFIFLSGPTPFTFTVPFAAGPGGTIDGVVEIGGCVMCDGSDPTTPTPSYTPMLSPTQSPTDPPAPATPTETPTAMWTKTQTAVPTATSTVTSTETPKPTEATPPAPTTTPANTNTMMTASATPTRTHTSAGTSTPLPGHIGTSTPTATPLICAGSAISTQTCNPPGVLQPPNNNVCRADCTYCGDGIKNGNETCDDGNTVDSDRCHNDCTRNMEEDPATIRFNFRHLGIDRLYVHGRFEADHTVDPTRVPVGIRLRNASAVLYRAELPAGAVTVARTTARSTTFLFRDPHVKSDPNGGIALFKVVASDRWYRIYAEGFGDMSAATSPAMTIEVFFADEQYTSTGTWVRTAKGWKRPFSPY